MAVMPIFVCDQSKLCSSIPSSASEEQRTTEMGHSVSGNNAANFHQIAFFFPSCSEQHKLQFNTSSQAACCACLCDKFDITTDVTS